MTAAAFTVAALCIAFSAFTVAQKNTKKATSTYFFYQVVNGVVDTGSPLNAEAMTVDDFQQINPVSCPSGNNADCIRAWEEGNTPTATGSADYTIRKL